MDSWKERLSSVVEELEFVGDWNDRYRLLVEWGDELSPLPEDERTSQTEVFGCSSPLWLRVKESAGQVSVAGYSTGVLPRALVALLVKLFDKTAAGFTDPNAVLGRLELSKHLSPTRVMIMETMLRRIAQGPCQ